MEHLFLAAAVAADNSAGATFLRYLPLAVLIVSAMVAVWLFASVRRMLRRSKPLHDRSLAHMDRLESKTDAMIALLREIRDKLERE